LLALLGIDNVGTANCLIVEEVDACNANDIAKSDTVYDTTIMDSNNGW